MLGFKGAIPSAKCESGALLSIEQAIRLIEDGDALRKLGRFALADYLACVALEETGKGLLLLEAWILSDSSNWDAGRGGWKGFWRDFRSHDKKWFAAWAQCLRGPGCADRLPSASVSKLIVPRGREKEYEKPKHSVFYMKEASLYIDYNPDLESGRFISPMELDSDPVWRETVEKSSQFYKEQIRQRQRLIQLLDDSSVQACIADVRAAFDANDPNQFVNSATRFLGFGRSR